MSRQKPSEAGIEEGMAVKQTIVCDNPDHSDRAGRGYVITFNGTSTHVDLCLHCVENEPLGRVLSWGRPGPGPDIPASRRHTRQKGEAVLSEIRNFDDAP